MRRCGKIITNELLVAYKDLLRSAIAERDCLYESHANENGIVMDEEGRQAIEQQDKLINRAQLALNFYEVQNRG